MVLEELGGKISGALRNLSGGDTIDKAAFDAALKEIANALVQSDVEVSLVLKMRTNIQKKVNITELGAGIDKHAVIEKAVRDELCALLDGSGEASLPKPKRGKPYVVMFVGLQVRTRARYAADGIQPRAHSSASADAASACTSAPERLRARAFSTWSPERAPSRGALCSTESLWCRETAKPQHA
jgi:hypothetical protein